MTDKVEKLYEELMMISDEKRKRKRHEKRTRKSNEKRTRNRNFVFTIAFIENAWE